MSSAALQNPPSSVPALNTSSLGPGSPSNRYNSASHPSPTQESYHAQSQQSGASPASSSRRPSRRPSGNSASRINNDGSYSGHNSPMSSRAALTSPQPVAGGSSDYQSTTDRERRRNHHSSNMPAVVPPRTSSTQHGGSSSAGGSSSRRTHTSEQRGTNSSRRTQDASTAEDPVAASQSSRSRRHQQTAPEPQERTSSNRDGRGAGSSTNLPIRSQQPPAQSPPSGPSREASEILNSILVSDPAVDIERERQRQEMVQPHHVQELDDDEAAPPPVVATTSRGEEPRQAARSRHDHSRREKQTRFGEYILGNTIGEGEFGKVKLGWKPGGVQVAIKLIKKDQLGSNPTRMAKIMREVAILRQLTHPNIVRLHKMEESERHYGIVLEYASGGELFDYILNHRYLKDNAARRLFAQLVSGVGYLHKKGIVHRDLKLENLLLDAHKNIIITDFGFANTFDPAEELSEEEETNLTDRDVVKRLGLDKVKPNGMRKGDLMQTSCGSPCYAAPELVVSDSLYTGRKVDVWSCGVILYAMLAGYLPFDDDPANPEGDNINLLYKYIVSTPLTFPEYVTPHARDLLRRILVPNPRKRADLFEVARHSWLSEYAHVVELITSATTTPSEIQNTSLNTDDEGETHVPHRSNSVRENAKKAAASPTVGGLTSKQGGIDQDEVDFVKAQKDAKRRTVQVEYVEPRTQTRRGDSSGSQAAGKTRARSGSAGPVEVSSSNDKPLPRDPPVTKPTTFSSRRPPSAHKNVAAGPTRPNRDNVRAISDNPYMTSIAGASGARPPTGGSMQSTRSGHRGSYSQPLPPEVADTNAHGRIQQPSRGSDKTYGMASPSLDQNMDYVGRPSISAVPPKFARVSGFAGEGGHDRPESGKGHRRSNTIGEISGKLFGRSGSLFGGRKAKRTDQPQTAEKKRYPPVSMNYSMPGGEEAGRPSVDSRRSSRRSFSNALGRKRSGSVTGSQTSQDKQSNRRFSFIPAGFSLKAIGIGKDEPVTHSERGDSQLDLPLQEPPSQQRVDQYGRPYAPGNTVEGMYAQLQPSQHQDPAEQDYRQQQQQQPYAGRPSGQFDNRGAVLQTESESSIDAYGQGQGQGQRQPPSSRQSYQPPTQQQQQQYEAMQQRFGPPNAPVQYDARKQGGAGRNGGGGGGGKGAVLQKNKRFVDAWDTDDGGHGGGGHGRANDHSGSSGPARKVMDFFRRRGKARGGE